MCCMKTVSIESTNAAYTDMVFPTWKILNVTFHRVTKDERCSRGFIVASERLPNPSSMFVRIGDSFEIDE